MVLPLMGALAHTGHLSI